MIDEISATLKSLKRVKALVAAHDDPDGISSALIMSDLLSKMNIEAEFIFPPSFQLLPEQIPGYGYDVLFILDKGTFPAYDYFADKFSQVIVIDHHFFPKYPSRCLVFNDPTLYPCSNSYLVAKLYEKFFELSPRVLFYTAIGLKGDFVVDPPSGKVSHTVEDIYNRFTETFPWMVEVFPGRPTMFDVEQRVFTSLLSQIAEVVHATGGGGFQYFFHLHNPDFLNIDHPKFVFDNFRALTTNDIFEIRSLQHLFKALPQGDVLALMFKYYTEEWDSLLGLMSLVNKLKNGVYFFAGRNLRLLPMLVSIRVHRIGEPALLLGINIMDEKVHITLRANNPSCEAGDFASKLASAFKKYGFRSSGGGHPMAAECVVEEPLTLGDVLSVITEVI